MAVTVVQILFLHLVKKIIVIFHLTLFSLIIYKLNKVFSCLKINIPQF